MRLETISTRKLKAWYVILGFLFTGILAFLEKLVSNELSDYRGWIVTTVSTAASLGKGVLLGNVYNRTRFKKAILNFMNTLKLLRQNFPGVPTKAVQQVMLTAVSSLAENLDIKLDESTDMDKALAGKHDCNTCGERDHPTDVDGQCSHCKLGASYWVAMNDLN